MQSRLSRASTLCVVLPKPVAADRILPAIRKRWPKADVRGYLANAFYVQPPLPRDLPISEVPSLTRWSPAIVDPVSVARMDARFPDQARFLRSADMIISACDPDYRGALTFAGVLSHHIGVNLYEHQESTPEFPVLDVEALYRKTGEIGIGSTQGASYRALLRAGAVHRQFSLNWGRNAAPVLGMAMRAVGLMKGFPSKIGLQMLYALRQHNGFSYSRALHFMKEQSFGSLISRGPILDDLVALGLVSKTDIASERPVSSDLRITEAGARFLDLLHKRSEDPDLGRRLRKWMLAGDHAAPNRYVQESFSRQKRFFPKSLAIHGLA